MFMLPYAVKDVVTSGRAGIAGAWMKNNYDIFFSDGKQNETGDDVPGARFHIRVYPCQMTQHVWCGTVSSAPWTISLGFCEFAIAEMNAK